MKPSSSWEAASRLALQEYPNFYGTRRVTTVLIGACHWSSDEARSIQCTAPNSVSLRFIMKLSHLFPGLPSILFSFGFPVLSRRPYLDYSNYIWRRIQVIKLLIMHFPASFCVVPLAFRYSPQDLVIEMNLVVCGKHRSWLNLKHNHGFFWEGHMATSVSILGTPPSLIRVRYLQNTSPKRYCPIEKAQIVVSKPLV